MEVAMVEAVLVSRYMDGYNEAGGYGNNCSVWVKCRVTLC